MFAGRGFNIYPLQFSGSTVHYTLAKSALKSVGCVDMQIDSSCWLSFYHGAGGIKLSKTEISISSHVPQSTLLPVSGFILSSISLYFVASFENYRGEKIDTKNVWNTDQRTKQAFSFVIQQLWLKFEELE